MFGGYPPSYGRLHPAMYKKGQPSSRDVEYTLDGHALLLGADPAHPASILSSGPCLELGANIAIGEHELVVQIVRPKRKIAISHVIHF